MAAIEKQIMYALAQKTGRAVDLAYSSLVHQLGLTQRFFKEGFGQLELIDFHLDVELFQKWPPDHFEQLTIQWKKLREGTYNGHAYEVFKGFFPTPCFGRIYDALPPESRTATAMWVLPKRPAHQTACMVHLAATGDHGFARRTHLGLPLVEQGIATLALESPFYGERKPDYQQGAKLQRVSDLLLLGRATIEESLFLLQWLSGQGHLQLGMSGLSMGGVHASMATSLYPGPLALTPLLAPRSAAASYCGGALYHATAWDKIVADSIQREQDIVRVVSLAARQGGPIAAARIKRIADAAAALQKESKRSPGVAAAAAVDAAGTSVRSSAAESAAGAAVGVGARQDGGGQQPPFPSGGASSSPSWEAIGQQEQPGGGGRGDGGDGQQKAAGSYQQRGGEGSGAGPPLGGVPAGETSSTTGHASNNWNWKRIGRWLNLYSDSLEEQLGEVQKLEGKNRHEQAVVMLREVLETYTDVTRFPVPQCPEAAVLVAATEDAYVSPESVVELHKHWPGSEVRFVPGGHVSSFLLHHNSFRRAIIDALDRLPPQCKRQE